MRSSTARPSSAPRVALASAAVKHPGRGNFCSPHWTILKDGNYVREGHELRVVFVSSEGQRWEASRAVRV